MTPCVHCRQAKGKRPCPALHGPICSPCCGQYRLVEIDCPPDCPFLASERYQADRRQERGVRKGADYVRARLRIFPGEDAFALAMEIEEHVYRYARVHGPVEESVIASALDALRLAFGSVVVASAPSHPLAKGLVQAANDSRGPFSKYRELQPGARAKIVARLAEDVRSRAGEKPGYLDLLRPFFDEVADPRALIAEERAKRDARVSEGGIILP